VIPAHLSRLLIAEKSSGELAPSVKIAYATAKSALSDACLFAHCAPLEEVFSFRASVKAWSAKALH